MIHGFLEALETFTCLKFPFSLKNDPNNIWPLAFFPFIGWGIGLISAGATIAVANFALQRGSPALCYVAAPVYVIFSIWLNKGQTLNHWNLFFQQLYNSDSTQNGIHSAGTISTILNICTKMVLVCGLTICLLGKGIDFIFLIQYFFALIITPVIGFLMLSFFAFLEKNKSDPAQKSFKLQGLIPVIFSLLWTIPLLLMAPAPYLISILFACFGIFVFLSFYHKINLTLGMVAKELTEIIILAIFLFKIA